MLIKVCVFFCLAHRTHVVHHDPEQDKVINRHYYISLVLIYYISVGFNIGIISSLFSCHFSLLSALHLARSLNSLLLHVSGWVKVCAK